MPLLLDIRSLNVASASVSLVLASAMLVMKVTRRTYPGFGLWVGGAACASAALLLYGTQGALPPAASIVLPNTLMFLHVALTTAGMERFLGLRARWAVHAGGTAAVLATSILFALVTPSVTWRIAIECALVAAWAGWATALVAREGPRVLGSPSRLAPVALGLYCAANAARLVVTLTHGDAANALAANHPVHALFFTLLPAYLALLALSLTVLDLQRVERDLAAASEEVHLLRGIIPICASCKKVREGEAWTPVEQYLAARSRADFSHGLCPECAERLYPEHLGPA